MYKAEHEQAVEWVVHWRKKVTASDFNRVTKKSMKRSAARAQVKARRAETRARMQRAFAALPPDVRSELGDSPMKPRTLVEISPEFREFVEEYEDLLGRVAAFGRPNTPELEEAMRIIRARIDKWTTPPEFVPIHQLSLEEHRAAIVNYFGSIRRKQNSPGSGRRDEAIRELDKLIYGNNLGVMQRYVLEEFKEAGAEYELWSYYLNRQNAYEDAVVAAVVSMHARLLLDGSYADAPESAYDDIFALDSNNSDDDASSSLSPPVSSTSPLPKVVYIDKSSGDLVNPLVVAQRMAECDRQCEDESLEAVSPEKSRQALDADAVLLEWQAFVAAPPAKVSKQMDRFGNRNKVSCILTNTFRHRRHRQLGLTLLRCRSKSSARRSSRGAPIPTCAVSSSSPNQVSHVALTLTLTASSQTPRLPSTTFIQRSVFAHSFVRWLIRTLGAASRLAMRLS